MESVSVPLAVAVLEEAMDRVGLGDAVGVFDRLAEPVVVLETRIVAVDTEEEVEVLEDL